jgi:hypothetical protein
VIGDRIRLCELGRRRSPKTPEFGTVVRVSRSGTSFVVLLDGRLRPIRLHWTYVEPLGELDVTADRFAMR